MMKVESLNCPNCIAPLHYSPGQTVAICLYCNSSIKLMLVDHLEQPAPQATRQEGVPADVIEQVKQLVVDGKQAEAVQLYQAHTGVTFEEAETAVNKIANSIVWALTGQIPLNARGIIVSLLLILAAAAGIVWSILNALNADTLSFWHGLLALVSAAVFIGLLRWFIPKIWSTLVASYGQVARAEVLKTAVIRRDFRRDGTLVVVLLEVQPEGSPAFRDQETLLVYNHSLAKIQPGKIIQVRFNPGNQDRVFPVSPIKAWDPMVGEFL